MDLKTILGKVNRPSAGAGEEVVTLTATISKGEDKDSLELTATVIPWSDAEAVAMDVKDLTFEVMLGQNPSETQVTKDLNLPKAGKMGTTVSWVSNNPSVISDIGVVTRPTYTTGDLTIKLTALVELNGLKQTKDFTVTVLALPITLDEELTLYLKDLQAKSFLMSPDTDPEAVTVSLNLPLSGPAGISCMWTSDNEAVIDANGNVSRPSSAMGAQVVSLTLTASKNSTSKTKQFRYKVLAE